MNAASELSERQARLEGIIEQMDRRFESIDRRLDSIDRRLTGIESSMRQGFFWFVGIQITTLLTLGALILIKLG